MARSPLLTGAIAGANSLILVDTPGLSNLAWQSKVTRGTFVLPGNPSMSRTFMFNPTEVADDKATMWGTIEIPGASHPVYQFGAGGERLITFDLWVDGDRGRFGRTQARDVTSLSIQDELQFYRSLVYPQEYGATMSAVFPYIVIFSMGTLYQRLPCIVKKCSWKVKFWTPLMEPVRAVISMQLGEVVNQSVTAAQVLQLGGFTTNAAGY